MGQLHEIGAAVVSMVMIAVIGTCGETSPAKQAQSAGSEFKTETQVADDQHHVLPGYQVKRLKDELETFLMEGKMIEFSGPVPSYAEVNGARVMQSIQNETTMRFGADKSYTLIAMCTGEGGASVEWQFGAQCNMWHLDCRPYSGTQYGNAGMANMGVSGLGVERSVVKITADKGTKAEIAYRIAESDASALVADDGIVGRNAES